MVFFKTSMRTMLCLLTFLMANVTVVSDIFRSIAAFYEPLQMPIFMFVLTSNLTPLSFSMSMLASSITGVTWWCVIQRRRHDTLGVDKNACCRNRCYLKHLNECAICQWRRCGWHCLRQRLIFNKHGSQHMRLLSPMFSVSPHRTSYVYADILHNSGYDYADILVGV
jgi:hypothetical protein